MKRVNIYITPPQEERIANIADVLNVTRAEVVRLAVNEFSEKHQQEINTFMEKFNGNDNSKKDVEQTFLRECLKYPKFFIKNAVKINTHNRLFDMGSLQGDLIDILHEHNEVIINKSIQCGATTTHLAYMLHYAVFNPNTNLLIVSHNTIYANQLLDNFKALLLSLPKFMQPKIIKNTVNRLELDNGTKIMAYSISNYYISGINVNVREINVRYIYMDEIAYFDTNELKEFMNAFHPKSQEGKCKLVISSNPHGFNEFYHLWSEALTGYNNLQPVCIPWQSVPGRDEKWKEEQIKCIGKRVFKQEYECKFIGNNMLFPGLKEAPMMSF